MSVPRKYLPSVNLLCAFEATARACSFTLAAKELDLTQSAVSRQVKALENQLGVLLFRREGQKISLTATGETYLQEISEALKKIASASISAQSNAGGGTLNLAVLPTFGARWLAPRLSGFFAQNPGITVHFTTRLKPFDFAVEQLDAAIHFGRPTWGDAEMVFLMGETVLPVCAPAFLQRNALQRPEQVFSAPLIHLSSRPDAWNDWLHTQNLSGKTGSGIVFDQFAAAAQAAVHGTGIALLPEFLIEQELAEGKLVRAFDAPLQSKESYYFVWPERRSKYPPLVAFRDWVLENANHSGGVE